MNERLLYRMGAVAAIVGSLLGVVFNILHPRTPELTDTEVLLHQFASSRIWLLDHLGIILAGLLTLGGLIAFARSITDNRGAAFAYFANAGALLSGSVLVTFIAIDGIVHPIVARAWLDASSTDAAVALSVAQVVNEIVVALFSVWIVVHFGVTMILYGLAVALGEGYPKWLGWVAIAFGIGSVVIGVMQSANGLSVLVTNILFPLFSVVLTTWVLVMGILLWRKSNE